jgi:hypothetical protein
MDRCNRTDFRFRHSARLTSVLSRFVRSLFHDLISIETVYHRLIVRLINIKKFIERKLVGETGVWGHNAPSLIFSTTNPEWPDLGANPGRSGWKPTPVGPHPFHGLPAYIGYLTTLLVSKLYSALVGLLMDMETLAEWKLERETGAHDDTFSNTSHLTCNRTLVSAIGSRWLPQLQRGLPACAISLTTRIQLH